MKIKNSYKESYQDSQITTQVIGPLSYTKSCLFQVHAKTLQTWQMCNLTNVPSCILKLKYIPLQMYSFSKV